MPGRDRQTERENSAKRENSQFLSLFFIQLLLFPHDQQLMELQLSSSVALKSSQQIECSETLT